MNTHDIAAHDIASGALPPRGRGHHGRSRLAKRELWRGLAGLTFCAGAGLLLMAPEHASAAPYDPSRPGGGGDPGAGAPGYGPYNPYYDPNNPISPYYRPYNPAPEDSAPNDSAADGSDDAN